MPAPPTCGDDWVGVTHQALPVDAAMGWTRVPSCGAQVCFTGSVRDHAPERPGVTVLEYEAYTEHVESRLAAVAADARARWPGVGRIVLLHRVGRLELTEVAVVVAVSAPHREEAFAAARFAIDALKATAPIWKKEFWEGGDSWAGAVEPMSEPSR